MLTPEERSRYARHLVLPEIGEDGQRRLKRASVILIGAGGLGSPSAMYLAAAGVGRIGIADYDRVDTTNLQRQILYGTSSVGRAKVDAARDRLTDLNPLIRIETIRDSISSRNALQMLEPYDIVIDGTDNFPTRYLVNDACVILRKPNVYGSVFRFEGQVSVFDAMRGPCYRCLYPEPPPPHLVPSCAEGGVLGVLPGVIGTLQAVEAVKIAADIGQPLVGRLLMFDAMAMSFRTMKLEKNPQCKVCGPDPEIRQLIDYERFCNPVSEHEITPSELHERLTRGEQLFLLDVREPHEFDHGHLDRALLIPLQQVPKRATEIPSDAEVIVICRSGARSAHAQRFLAQSGFKRVKNLVGGMLRWKKDVDPNVNVS